MSCIITDTCAHCRTIFVRKGHCPFTVRHGQHQSSCIDPAVYSDRPAYLERNGYLERTECLEETRHLERIACLGRIHSLQRSSSLDNDRCLERQEISQRQQSEFKQHPTPFGIRNILGLGDADNSHKNEISDTNGIFFSLQVSDRTIDVLPILVNIIIGILHLI